MRKGGVIHQALTKAGRQLIHIYLKWLFILALVIYCLSGIYQIKGDAVGVLSRFGKIVEPRVLPGLHYKLPWPIDKIDIVPVREVKTLVIRDFSSGFQDEANHNGASGVFFRKTKLVPYCITGDNNIIAITLVIKYTIDDPVQYLYGITNPAYFMECCTADLIVHHLACLEIDKILTFGKKQLELDIQTELISKLAQFNTGIRLTFLEIKEITPPEKVQQYFDKVINAEVEKKKVLNQAQGKYNRAVPAARSEANAIVQSARAYKSKKILAAEGQAARFSSRYQAYKKNPEANLEKIYLDFIKTLYPKLGEIRVVKNREHDPMTTLLIPSATIK
ncbi:MAG: FtsH protease activity modulator HflK [Desulfobacterales bacterium]|nr:FtsH protease activity modulator HflK [Desulfobacterales bacterium]